MEVRPRIILRREREREREHKKILLYQWVTYIYKKDATRLPIRKFHYQQEQYSQIPVWLTGVYYAFLASSQEKMPLC